MARFAFDDAFVFFIAKYSIMGGLIRTRHFMALYAVWRQVFVFESAEKPKTIDSLGSLAATLL